MNSIKLLTLLLMLLVALLLGVSYGALSMHPFEIPQIVFNQKPELEFQVLWNIRIPRVLLAALVGMCLAVAGTILQCVLRNPLAAPNIIGVSSGAGFVGYVLLILFPAYADFLPLGAFVGAMLTAIVVYGLSWQGGIQPSRLVMAGVAVSAFLGAGTSTLILFFPDRIHGVLIFMVGGLGGVSWPAWHMAWPYALVGLIGALASVGWLNQHNLGDTVATGLGLRVELTRFLLLGLASLLAATSVSVAGLLGFVGLIVPHMVRLWVGPDHKWLIPASAIGGAALVTLADLVGRLILDPMEIPVGIPMALLGGPFFLYLLRTRSV